MTKHVGKIETIDWTGQWLFLVGEYGQTTSKKYCFGVTLREKVREVWGKNVELIITGANAISDIKLIQE